MIGNEHLDLADLKINGMSVVNSTYKKNLSVDYQEWEKNNPTYQIDLTPQIGVSKNNENSARLILSATLFSKEFEKKGEPFYFHVEMVFFFLDTVEHSDGKNVVEHYLTNMISMAFPYVRSYMQTVTALSGIAAVTIPPINVVSLIKQLESSSQKSGPSEDK